MLSYILLIFHISTLFHLAFFDSFRLPDYIIPKHYNLKILTSIDDEIIYTGTLDIVTQCLNATNKISLHRDWSTKFQVIKLEEIDTLQNYKIINPIPLEEILYSHKMGFLTISTKEKLKESRYYLIHFEFKGNLTDTPTDGIFRGNFSSSSATSYYAITIFEPMGARKAFPCFDEPGMTATFELVIGRKEKYNSTSNMPLVNSEPAKGKDGWFWDHFTNSYPMSTYLVCFMIYDAEFSWTGKQRDQLKILARKQIVSSLNMITKTTPKLLEYLQKYFEVPFPFPKLDIIAVPHVIGKKDSYSTPGLVIIHEKLLYYEPFTMKQDDVQDILYDMTQKIALQWTSVVPINWWSDVWLRNSLTNYNTRYALSDLSDSKSMERDVPDSLLQYFNKIEGKPFSGEIYGDVASVKSELASIDYKKCGLLIRMAQHLTGDKALKDITNYILKENQLNQRDIWKMFENFSPKNMFVTVAPLGEVVKSWTNQGGFPVVEVKRDYKTKTATLIQKAQHITIDGKMPCWWIPITYAVNNESKYLDTNVREWLRCPNETVELKSLPSSDWVLLNLKVNFLYRVKYDFENWKLLHLTLREPLLYETIPSLNRMQLVDDLFEFTARGYLNIAFEFLLEFMEFLRFDQSYATWAAFSKNMFILHWKLHSNKEAMIMLDTYMQNLLRRHFSNRTLDTKENSLLNVSFSALITETSCFFKLQGCLNEVNTSFKKYRETKQPFHVDPPFSTDMRDIILCYAIKHGGVGDFNFLLSAFTKSTNLFEREDMLRGLYCTQDTSLLKNIPKTRKVRRSVTQLVDQGTASNATSTIIPIIPGSTKKFTPTSKPGVSVYTSDTTGSSVVSPHPNDPEGSGDAAKSKVDSDGPDLGFIILRSKIDIVSDLFYKKIAGIAIPEALHYIWLYTERISEKKELDNFERFFENHKEAFHDIERQIKDRVEHVKWNLEWQKNKTDEVIKALKKNLGIKDTKKRSQASRYSVNNTLKLFSVLGILNISVFPRV